MSRKEKRTERLRVYLSPSEKQNIEEEAEEYDLPVSSYCRKILLNHKGDIYE